MNSQVVKKRGRDKTALKGARSEAVLAKPSWLRGKSPDCAEVERLTGILREHNLHTVCEEANCPNVGECFRCGTATFIIMGDVCTRRCPFCDVAHGRPGPLDTREPENLALVVKDMGLKYVVVTSVNRDDLPDKGAGHFAACIRALRERSPHIKVEILVPDFRGREALALDILDGALPDVFNHNLETVPRLYGLARPGADYRGSLELLRLFKERHPGVPTKSGLMVGLGEEDDEILAVMKDLRDHGCDMLTIGQYLRPSRDHLPVKRYVTPEAFEGYRKAGLSMGFSQVASAPLVRSSYHAELQAKDIVSD
jgi:lipoic acid synthetase